MSFLDDLLDLCPHTFSWAPVASRDGFNKRTFSSTPVTDIRGRLVHQMKRVRNREGVEVISGAHAWLMGDYAIDPDDEVTLPDGTKPPIIVVQHYPEEDGTRHTKVFFR